MWGDRTTGRCRLGAAVALSLLAAPLSAQRIRREIGVQGYLLSGDVDRSGGGVYVARRAGPRARLSLFAGADGGAAGTIGRGEALVHLLVAPARRRGAAPYLAGGLAVDVAQETEARLVALIGVEGAPGGPRGWILEAGVGGGWRVAAGWRWRG